MKECNTAFKEWCAKNGHTARSVSEKMGISYDSVRSYMIGRRYPSREVQKRFEEVYGVDARELFPL